MAAVAAVIGAVAAAVNGVDWLLRLRRRRLRPLLSLCGHSGRGCLGRLGLRLPHLGRRHRLLLLLPLVGVDALLVVLVPAGVLVPVAAVVVTDRG